MADSRTMSRRDWFRLLPRRFESELVTDAVESEPMHATVCAMGAASHGLQAIPHPENHDGLNLADLPPLREAVLSEEQTRQLFADIEAFASDILLMQRLAGSARATTSTSTMEQLRTTQHSLLTGAITRVQIRYRWQESYWIDTLECQGAIFRLVRIAHHLAPMPGRARP